MNEPTIINQTELTAEIVAAFVSNNHVQASELPELIRTVHQTLDTLGQAPAAPAPAAEQLKPAVPIKKSVNDDYLVSLFDGRRFKSLKRHLAAEHGMTPDEYRTMFGLPSDYPMVAPAYAKQRSALAKSLGLGRKARGAGFAPATEAVSKPKLETLLAPEKKIEPSPTPVPAKKRSRARTAV